MKNWLWERFLPMWAKQTLWKERDALVQENDRLKGRIKELESYIRGIHRALRTNGQLRYFSLKQDLNKSQSDTF